MLFHNIIRSSFTLAFLLSLPTWSAENTNQSAMDFQPRNMEEYFQERNRLLDLMSTRDRPDGKKVTNEERRLASEKYTTMVCPSENRPPLGDVDEMYKQLSEKIDNGLKPMRDQVNDFQQLVSPWAQTLNHHASNGTLSQEVLEQVKTDAREKGYTVDISDFEKILQNYESERNELELAREKFLNGLEKRFVDHYKKGTLTQQVLDGIREEAANLGIPLVLEGIPEGLQ